MFPRVITSCFLITTILQTGWSALIETKETVWAAVGDQASLSCRLTEDKDVLQITWQKVLPLGEKNLATYTKKFGYRVSSGLEEKMDFQYESLQSCSMVIRKVTEQDEGCYRCLFNTYPKGALISWTCLKLCELHGPFIDVSRSNSPPGSVVTCSATGRPVPMVTLTVLHQNLSFSHYNTSRVSNTNGTVTFTTTALLSALNTTQVGCSVSVQTTALRELLVTVPGLTETSGDAGLDVEPGSSSVIVGLSVAAALLFVVCVAAFISVLLRKWAEKRENENALDNLAKDLFSSCMDTEEMKDATGQTRTNIRESEDASDMDSLVVEPPVIPMKVTEIVCPLPHPTRRSNKDQPSSEEPREKSDFENVNHKKTN
ncbi:OX-2 membrane glycoprotein-like isoform X1 [Xiphophorus couchianus]|uniref:OX-2 membrane glycoprotein-like isoform X1 n=1 Tax=Xiphophorus couchianus TaxID=32473 RepID=UPI001015DA3B|nr:OX-2 membrane glycoprotein-like isoform X1 [Xiphophorus couchianus]